MLWVLWLIVQMVLIIAGLLAVVGAFFYVLCWLALSVVQVFPIIGRRHKHPRWDEMNQRSGRK
jgi:hypothetical protein